MSDSTSPTVDLPELEAIVLGMAQRARAAAHKLATTPTAHKNAALLKLVELIQAAEPELQVANAKDIEAGEEAGLSSAMLDRLKLTEARIEGMCEGLRQVAALPDPVGEEIERTTRPNGLEIRKLRVPMGVIGIIYESRPNVTIDCAALCLKSGNACILRGGKEAFHTNTALAKLVTQALKAANIDPNTVQLVPTVDRKAMQFLLKLDTYVQCIIPRGGDKLIRFVVETATMPVIKHYTGVCNMYLDKELDANLAEAVTVNSKTQRPGVCNAIENLLVHSECAEEVLPQVARALAAKAVHIRADERALAIMQHAGVAAIPATEEDWGTEYLDLIISVKVVDSVEEAVQFINYYGSGHSDAIVTTNDATARTFMDGVDTATTYHNASTRFTDGFEFGLGAEIGISTDRLHARGPMGLRELCTYKHYLYGTGQVRQ